MTSRTLGPLGVKALEARSIDPEIAARLEIHTARSENGEVISDPNGNVIVFPFLEDGVTVAEKYRARGPDGGKRFWQKAGGKRVFYNVDALDDPSLVTGENALVITEGEIDCLSAMTVGFPLSVSVPDGAPPPPKDSAEKQDSDDANGKFAFLWECRDRLKVIRKFVLAADNDAPGKHLAEELVRRLGPSRCYFVTYPEGCKDLNDALLRHGPQAAHDVIANAQPYPLRGVYRLSEYPDRPAIETVSTGWSTLDALFRPFAPSTTVVTGLPGSGKSTLILNLCVNLAQMHGWKSAVFSPELPVSPFLRDKLRRIVLGESLDLADARQIARADYWIDANIIFIDHDVDGNDDQDLTLEWLIARAYDALMRYGVRVFVIDPWNEISHDKESRESTTEYANRAIRTLIKFARRHGLALFILCHPSKDVAHGGKSRVPTLYDIADSAAFFNKPDFGIVVDWPDPNVERTWVYVKKVRFENTGSRGAVVLQYNRQNSRYELLSEGDR